MLYPTIGIPMPGKDLLSRYMYYPYIRCLRKSGATVQFLMPSAETLDDNRAFTQCDGLLFPGGPDLWPGLYNQERLPECKEPQVKRDNFELSLLGAGLKLQKPLLCIGRGMQLLNILLGGTLIQDIKPQQEYPHLDPSHRTTATHPIELDPDSLISYLLNSDTAAVNSLHHQAVDDPGKGLWIAADSPDGFVEALQLEDYPFCLAVQWHPEYMVFNTPSQQRLFQALTDACK